MSSLRFYLKENTYFFVPGSNSNVMNNFPHAFLTTNKQTLPISLVHIFTAIATRLGLNASPINFPGTVLAHVLPRHEAAEPIIVNTASHPTNTILNPQINSLDATNLPPFHPCTGLLMLMRASRNILSSLMSIHDVRPSILHPSLLLSICVHLLFQADDDILDRLLADAYLQAWDCIFLLERLAPSLMSRCRGMIRSHCQTVLDAEAAAELSIHSRTGVPVKYFVGMAFEHVKYKYIGFIYGWHVSPSFFFLLCLVTDMSFKAKCEATEDWVEHMSVEALPRGRNQPFYNVFSDDGSNRCKYDFIGYNMVSYAYCLVSSSQDAAEDNIWPVAFTKEHVQAIFHNCAEFSVYFDGGVDFPNENIGRLHMSPQAHYAYPDDEAVGLRWLKHGVLS